ncbi:hypothetical protein Q7P37_006969 [Cladosporium fusiforme]
MSRIQFDCAVCQDERDDPQDEVRSIEGDQICPDCAPEIARQFENAIQHEFNYPPKWAGTPINFDDFKDLLSPELCQQWYRKIEEYETPVQDRVYCKHQIGANSGYGAGNGPVVSEICNRFLGSVDRFQGSEKKMCECKHFVCMGCGEPVWPLAFHRHRCQHQDGVPEEVFDEALRGREWQRCPNASCRVAVELKTGCNHMDCTFCGTAFCFICGEEAEGDSGHWSMGNPCPRYNHPDDNNAAFDTFRPLEGFGDEGGDFTENPQRDDDLLQDGDDMAELHRRFQAELVSRANIGHNVPQELWDALDLIEIFGAQLSWAHRSWLYDQPDYPGLLLSVNWEMEQWREFQQNDVRLAHEFTRACHVAETILGADNDTFFEAESVFWRFYPIDFWDRYILDYRHETVDRGFDWVMQNR